VKATSWAAERQVPYETEMAACLRWLAHRDACLSEGLCPHCGSPLTGAPLRCRVHGRMDGWAEI
jgi:hypothetical protein